MTRLYDQQRLNDSHRRSIEHYKDKPGYEALYERACKLLKHGEKIEASIRLQMNYEIPVLPDYNPLDK